MLGVERSSRGEARRAPRRVALAAVVTPSKASDNEGSI